MKTEPLQNADSDSGLRGQRQDYSGKKAGRANWCASNQPGRDLANRGAPDAFVRYRAKRGSNQRANHIAGPNRIPPTNSARPRRRKLDQRRQLRPSNIRYAAAPRDANHLARAFETILPVEWSNAGIQARRSS